MQPKTFPFGSLSTEITVHLACETQAPNIVNVALLLHPIMTPVSFDQGTAPLLTRKTRKQGPANNLPQKLFSFKTRGARNTGFADITHYCGRQVYCSSHYITRNTTKKVVLFLIKSIITRESPYAPQQNHCLAIEAS